MTDICNKCKGPLRYGSSIIQLAKGQYIQDHITPKYRSNQPILLEAHEECDIGIPIKPQRLPYVCSLCNRQLDHKDFVIYAVIGTKPTPQFKQPERRGKTIPFIAHEECWEYRIHSNCSPTPQPKGQFRSFLVKLRDWFSQFVQTK